MGWCDGKGLRSQQNVACVGSPLVPACGPCLVPCLLQGTIGKIFPNPLQELNTLGCHVLSACILLHAARGTNDELDRDECAVHCRAMNLSGSWRHGGVAPTTEVLQWRDTGSWGKTSQEDEERELLFM